MADTPLPHGLATGGGLLALLISGAALAAPVVGCDSQASGTTEPGHAAVAAVDASAYWLSARRATWPGQPADGEYRLYFAPRGGIVARPGARVTGAAGALVIKRLTEPLQPALSTRFKFVGAGPLLGVPALSTARLRALHRGELVLVREIAGRVLAATHLQVAGALDDLYAAAASASALGADVVESGRSASTGFRLWAPTARSVALCIYRDSTAPAEARVPLGLDAATGIWSTRRVGDLSGRYYLYLVEVLVPGQGILVNRVTDPYSRSLSADSARSYVARPDAPALKPPGWDEHPVPAALRARTDLVVYELHVRDFSASDRTVPPAHRGKYLAFTDANSDGMRHLRSLAGAGITDVQLLPVYDFAAVPERGCVEPVVAGTAAGEEQQAIIGKVKLRDCFSWGYTPLHFAAPEGSYSSDATDGARRIVELRALVAALHRAGLRVGMDLVFNHTFAAGQEPGSVLDRIVPGYYHRLDAHGKVEDSTCCANTATENAMMAKLMIDATVAWVRDYQIDSIRFDLMGHQPLAVMQRLKARVEALAHRRIDMFGEGWNFGEVANGTRFVQASQLELHGSEFGTFSDRARDALRGGRASEHAPELLAHQGYLNGLVYDRNALAAPDLGAADLLRTADLVRLGLAGSLREYPLVTADGRRTPLSALDYAGQPAGYAAEPGEVVNYVENHDNQTLYDINALKLPPATSAAERARVQVLGLATVAFSQGIAYFQAGGETLRSKSLDGDSFESGDWFNRLDWTLADNNFGVGLPPAAGNERDWPWQRPLLADPALKPSKADIEFTVAAFSDLLKIRSSSTLFRLRTASDVRERLTFFNVGPSQVPTVIAARLDGEGYPGAGFAEIVYLINVDRVPHELKVEALRGHALTLHPVHLAATAGDLRVRDARYDAPSGRFTLPPRTAVVYVGSATTAD